MIKDSRIWSLLVRACPDWHLLGEQKLNGSVVDFLVAHVEQFVNSTI